jgi:hypothetical protein
MRRNKSKGKLAKFSSPMAIPAKKFNRVPKVLGLGLFVTAFIVGIGAVLAPPAAREYLVFTKSLPAGSRLSESDIASVLIPVDNELMNYELNKTQLINAELAHSVQQGELVSRSDIKVMESFLRELTLSFEPNSMPPAIAKGDQLDLWVVPQDGAGNAIDPAKLVAANLIVAAAAADESGISTELPITFYVSPTQVAELLDAVAAGEIYLVRR